MAAHFATVGKGGERGGEGGKGTFYFIAPFRGRPRGRSVNSSPSFPAVRRCHLGAPKGLPRTTLVRSAASSASVCGWFTHWSQSAPRGTGPGSSRGASTPAGSTTNRRPRPTLRLPHAQRLGPHGIALHVAQHRQQMFVALNGKRLEPTLPHMAARAVMPMVAPHVAGQEPLHPAAQVAALARPQHQVKMIGHQRVADDAHRDVLDPFAGLDHQLQKGGVVVVFVKHLLPTVAAVQDVITVIAGRSPSRARHAHKLVQPPGRVKKSRMSPFSSPDAADLRDGLPLSARLGRSAGAVGAASKN